VATTETEGLFEGVSLAEAAGAMQAQVDFTDHLFVLQRSFVMLIMLMDYAGSLSKSSQASEQRCTR